MSKKIQIAIFASGSGSNAENISEYFQKVEYADVSLIITNRESAGVIERAEKLQIEHLVIPTKTWKDDPESISEILVQKEIDVIVLAGFLLKVPSTILEVYDRRIVNIHPALLPDFGGKGMYGKHVHEAVLASGRPISGITIHYVNDNYDEGQIIFQDEVLIEDDESTESLEKKIHALEYLHYPKIIDLLVRRLVGEVES